jgi:hypothetical protein
MVIPWVFPRPDGRQIRSFDRGFRAAGKRAKVKPTVPGGSRVSHSKAAMGSRKEETEGPEEELAMESEAMLQTRHRAADRAAVQWYIPSNGIPDITRHARKVRG